MAVLTKMKIRFIKVIRKIWCIFFDFIHHYDPTNIFNCVFGSCETFNVQNNVQSFLIIYSYIFSSFLEYKARQHLRSLAPGAFFFSGQSSLVTDHRWTQSCKKLLGMLFNYFSIFSLHAKKVP